MKNNYGHTVGVVLSYCLILLLALIIVCKLVWNSPSRGSVSDVSALVNVMHKLMSDMNAS